MGKKSAAIIPTAKTKRHRSPNYPSLDLRTACSKLHGMFDKMKRHSVGVEQAVGYMGYSFSSSTGKLALASLRAYGLIETESGADENAMVKLTTCALDISTDYPPESAEWKQAVKTAALSPNVHKQLWEKYGPNPPADDELRRYLTRELKFNDNVVDDFIEEYKQTIAFAKLSSEDIIIGEGIIDDDDILLPPRPAIPVKVGLKVQWVSNGQDQFKKPRLVTGMSDDRQWVFVEGSETGIPMKDTFVERGEGAGIAAPPKNPHYKPLAAEGPRIEFPLPDGNTIEIRLGKRVTKKVFEKIKQLVNLSEDSLVESGDSQERSNKE